MDASRPYTSQPRLSVVLALLCLVLFSAAAQADRSGLEQQLEHRRWTLNDNSPSQIGALAETHDGYLWLGTHDSLYRFDGFEFTSYRTPDGHDLGIVSSLLASDAGLWVGLRNGGVYLITSEKEQPSRFDLGSGVIYALARTADGSVWAAANDGLLRYDGKGWQRLGSAEGFLGNNAYSVLVDRGDRLWVADEQRLYVLQPGARALRDTGIRSNRTRQMMQAPDGALWLIERDRESLLRVDIGSASLQASRIAIGAEANAMLFDLHGCLWLSTAGSGLLHVAKPNEHGSAGFDTSERFTAREGLSSDFAWPLLEDSDGSLWIGTQNGLDRLRERPLLPAGFPANAHNLALGADDQGNLWAGSSNLPVMRLNDDGLHQLPLHTPISAISKAPDGSVWLAGPEGIWRSIGEHLEKVSALPVERDLDSSVRTLLIDRQGALWLSLNRQGLYVLRGGQWQRLPTPSANPTQLMPVSSALAPDGQRWFGYRDNLLVSHDDRGEHRWGSAEGLDIGHVTAMAHLQDHSWFGGQRGLARFDGKRFQNLPLSENGLFDNLYAIIPVASAQGEDLWLQGKGGVFQLPAEEIAKALNDPRHPIRYRTYDLQGGLANDPQQVLALPTAVRTAQGRLWFVTRNGVAGLKPGWQMQNSKAPKVSIESLVADGAGISLQAPMTLPADSKRLAIRYSALSLSAPEGLRFLYRLDGFDSDWHSAGRQREATYTGLPAGSYRFRVRALNQDGVPSEQDAELSFSIGQMFYRHPLFILAVALSVLLVLHLIYRSNMQRAAERLRTRLEERHDERERIARELHDTLLQGVQGLVLHVQAAADSLPADQPARMKLENALDRADQVIAEGRERVRNLRHAQEASSDLPQTLRELDQLHEHADTDYQVEIAGMPCALHPVVHDELSQLAREAVSNAFRHANASHVRVRLDYNPRQFSLSVSDDGRGLLAEYLQGAEPVDHWGLKGMYERAAKIGGTLNIHSAPGHGCQVQLALAGPLAYRQPHPRARRWLHWKRLIRSSQP
ncbi:sensor histidine kinase [Ectopseudomonas oleovorans]|uniref:sensor histidine kinase n=1 Tax=Ectopseudomonas oleovorans TaxID=301 RepID=UPI00201E54C3|nr:sensor histidine kinase [Pseudomonas oleovorans]